METKSSNRSGNVIGGLVLIALGIWFFLSTLGVRLPDVGNFWPIFPTLAGLAFIVAYARQRDAGLLIPGVGAFLIGLFFFLFTLGSFEWSQMGQLWPVFPLIGGLAFLAAYLSERDAGLLIPAVGGVGVGVIGLFFTLSGLSLAWLGTFWPVILILVGIFVLAQNLMGRNNK